MGNLRILRVVTGALLVGSVAWAQQGLILEPWRKAPQPVAAPIPAREVLPASGLGPSIAEKPARRGSGSAPAVRPALRWSPPVVELLVDPWAKPRVAAAQGARWVPASVEIVDPWAAAPATKPRLDGHHLASRHAPIF